MFRVRFFVLSLVLLLAGTVSSAWPEATLAASFDCKKATTSVEQTICADDELSRLDSNLDTVYRGEHNARKAADKKTLEREQGRWRRETRDVCKTRECIRDAYYARLATLDQIDERYIKDWKYPPYPELWGYDFAETRKDVTITGTWFAPNGDVLVRHYHCPPAAPGECPSMEPGAKRPWAYGYREFFAQKDHVISVDEYNHFEKLASVGSPVWPFRASKIRFRNGDFLSFYGDPTSGCSEPYTGHYEYKNSNGTVIWRKAIVVRKKEPYLVSCKYPGSVDYKITADVTRPGMFLLRDDTLLLQVGHAVIRFDSQLNTPYRYDSNRIYVVDYEVLQAVIERAKKRCDPYEPCLDDEMRKYLDSLQ